MSKRPERRRPISASELMARLESDPEYVHRRKLAAEKRRFASRVIAADAAPLLQELTRAGFSVKAVGELRQQSKAYVGAVPILTRWLSKVSSKDVKEDIVRTLSVPWAKTPEVARALLAEFERAESHSLRWAIANALEVTAGEEVLEALGDDRHRAPFRGGLGGGRYPAFWGGPWLVAVLGGGRKRAPRGEDGLPRRSSAASPARWDGRLPCRPPEAGGFGCLSRTASPAA